MIQERDLIRGLVSVGDREVVTKLFRGSWGAVVLRILDCVGDGVGSEG